ncbi:MAG: transporter substrate-binding domain-containing protein [Sneathiella sp.]
MFKNSFAIALAISLVTVTSHLRAEEIWKITSIEWQPYVGSEFTDKGSSAHILKELLKKRGITLALEFLPWKRSQEQAKTQEYVGYFPAWPSEVSEGFTASDPIDWSVVGLMQRTDHKITYESVDKLFKEHKVGIVSTYVYPKAIMDAIAKYPDHVDKSKDEIVLLRKLSKKRYDVAITDPNVMMYLAKKEGITNVEPNKEIIEKTALVIAFRNDAENQSRIQLMKDLTAK